ncbi:MAG: hypothetical protein QXE64_00245 [Candidatus Pacearchaeota archaeon]
MTKMAKRPVIALFIFFLLLTLIFVSGCKKEAKTAETPETLNASVNEIDSLINEIEALDVEVDLGNESLSEEESLL